MPIVVLTRGESRSKGWDEVQTALAALTSKSQVRIAESSGHEVPMEQPEAVTTAVQALLQDMQETTRDH